MNQDLYTNFEYAYKLSEKTLTNNEILNFLSKGNIIERQIAALQLNTIDTEEIADALMQNLVGVDGKIREAVAQKLFNILSQNNIAKTYFEYKLEYAKILAQATIDINGNICRYVIDTVNVFKDNENFIKQYTKCILEYALLALDELDKFIFRDKKYVINKQLFKLYWCLEALNYFFDFANEEILILILTRSSQQAEYTIREKVAQLLTKIDILQDIRSELMKDENYYVRSVFALNH